MPPDEITVNITLSSAELVAIAGVAFGAVGGCFTFFWREYQTLKNQCDDRESEQSDKILEIITNSLEAQHRTNDGLDSLRQQLQLSEHFQTLAMNLITKTLEEKT